MHKQTHLSKSTIEAIGYLLANHHATSHHAAMTLVCSNVTANNPLDVDAADREIDELNREDFGHSAEPAKPAMHLKFFPTNSAWAFIFGTDLLTATLCQLHGWPMFYERRSLAVLAASERGLSVDKDGAVTVSSPVWPVTAEVKRA